MGYPVNSTAPQVTIGADTYAVGSFMVNSVVVFFNVGLFKSQSDGWNQVGTAGGFYTGNLLAVIQSNGGLANYIHGVVETVNTYMRQTYGAPIVIPPTGEPTTEAEAQAAVTAALAALRWTIVGSVPVLG